MGYVNCPECQKEYFVKGEVMFHKPVFYFFCEGCKKFFVELPDGEWEEQEPFHEWLAKRGYICSQERRNNEQR